MRKLPGILVFFILLLAGLSISAQNYNTEQLKPDPEKERKFLPFLAGWHGGKDMQEWKQSNTLQYYKELWYFSQSFYVKRNHFSEGLTLDEAGFDVSRFEKQRKADSETILEFPGFKDAIVLIPARDLIYKPDYIR